ncbi:GLPGLI family protein [Moheibacter sp.]|uniref:GLPGLI family protein n=1 Tax=Moheibacter sp. TaxID=1965316 RepID=UPI003C724BD4
MKNRLLFLWVSILFGTFLFGQENLRVEYEVLPEFIPSQNTSFKVGVLPSFFELIISQNESQYEYIERINNLPSEQYSFIFQKMSEGTLYINLENKTFVQDVPFENKTYLVKDTLQPIDWKITREVKEILGFQVYKASGTMLNGAELIAWYAPKLNFKIGPERFWGLPGLVLAVETKIINSNGDIMKYNYEAIKVEVINSDTKIKIPQKGIEINQQTLDQMRREATRKQREMYGDGVDKD